MIIDFPSKIQCPIKSSPSTSTNHFKYIPCQGLTLIWAAAHFHVDAPSARQCGVERSKAPPRPTGRLAYGATTSRSSRTFFPP